MSFYYDPSLPAPQLEAADRVRQTRDRIYVHLAAVARLIEESRLVRGHALTGAFARDAGGVPDNRFRPARHGGLVSGGLIACHGRPPTEPSRLDRP